MKTGLNKMQYFNKLLKLLKEVTRIPKVQRLRLNEDHFLLELAN